MTDEEKLSLLTEYLIFLRAGIMGDRSHEGGYNPFALAHKLQVRSIHEFGRYMSIVQRLDVEDMDPGTPRSLAKAILDDPLSRKVFGVDQMEAPSVLP